MDLNQIIALAWAHKWLALAVVGSGWVVQLLTKDSKFWLSIPESWDPNRWKPFAILLAGQGFAALQRIENGMDWKTSVQTGLVYAFTTLGAYAIVVKMLFKDNIPAWMNVLALIFPQKPASTVPPPAAPPPKEGP